MTIYTRTALAIAMLTALTTGIAAQTDTPAQGDAQKARPRTTASGQEKKDQQFLKGVCFRAWHGASHIQAAPRRRR